MQAYNLFISVRSLDLAWQCATDYVRVGLDSHPQPSHNLSLGQDSAHQPGHSLGPEPGPSPGPHSGVIFAAFRIAGLFTLFLLQVGWPPSNFLVI